MGQPMGMKVALDITVLHERCNTVAGEMQCCCQGNVLLLLERGGTVARQMMWLLVKYTTVAIETQRDVILFLGRYGILNIGVSA